MCGDGSGHVRAVPVSVLHALTRDEARRTGDLAGEVGVSEVDPGVQHGDGDPGAAPRCAVEERGDRLDRPQAPGVVVGVGEGQHVGDVVVLREQESVLAQFAVRDRDDDLRFGGEHRTGGVLDGRGERTRYGLRLLLEYGDAEVLEIHRPLGARTRGLGGDALGDGGVDPEALQRLAGLLDPCSTVHHDNGAPGLRRKRSVGDAAHDLPPDRDRPPWSVTDSRGMTPAP